MTLDKLARKNLNFLGVIMNYFYCDDYSDSYKRIYSPYDESTAKKLHKNKEIYSVIFGTPERPKIQVKLMDNGVNVDFFNDNLQLHWCFVFQTINKTTNQQDVSSNDILLDQVICRKRNQDDEILEVVHYIYNQLRKKIYANWDTPYPNETRIKFEKNSKEFPDNWTTYPEFGKYEPIIQFCRDYRQFIIDNPPFDEIGFEYPEL